MPQKIKVSVIVPVFNTVKYLAQAVDSLLTQTLSDIEIILVDNGSTDGSLELLKKYASQHSNIVLRQVEGGRQGRCRNEGVKVARGEFIGFVDSDDWCEPAMYETLYNTAHQSGAEIAICKIQTFNEKGVIGEHYNNNLFKEGLYSPYAHVYLTRLTGSWNKIYKAELLKNNDIVFTEGVIHQDVPFTYKALFLAKAIAGTKETLYHYRIHNESATRESKKDPKQTKTIFDVFTNINALQSILFELKAGPEWQKAAEKTIAHHFNYLVPRLHPELIASYLEKARATIGCLPASLIFRLSADQIKALPQTLREEINTHIALGDNEQSKKEKKLKSRVRFYKKRYQLLCYALALCVVLFTAIVINWCN